MRINDLRNLLPIMSIYYTVLILGVLLIALSYLIIRSASSSFVSFLPLGGLFGLSAGVYWGSNLGL